MKSMLIMVAMVLVFAGIAGANPPLNVPVDDTLVSTQAGSGQLYIGLSNDRRFPGGWNGLCLQQSEDINDQLCFGKITKDTRFIILKQRGDTLYVGKFTPLAETLMKKEKLTIIASQMRVGEGEDWETAVVNALVVLHDQ